jgi:A/G-specific adenine glycosylase
VNRRSKSPAASSIAPALLAWYDRERRHLPWRYPPGAPADPYRVWLSEIMLQQTVAKTVEPYFAAFTTRWPTLAALAAAPLDDVLAAWAGLGYYARARNLHKCAQVVANSHGGTFPADEAALLELPGIGPYTAAAIAAIGFGLKATPVDGNVERVVARLFAIEEPLPASKAAIRTAAETITPAARAGDFAQAMMDLGATICTPRTPSCLVCPLRDDCRATKRGIADRLPAKRAKAERPTRRGTAYLVLRDDGHLLLRRRPDEGLLGGMMEVPSSPWEIDTTNTSGTYAPVTATWQTLNTQVSHVFTHFRLELSVARATVPTTAKLERAADPGRCRWVRLGSLGAEALPSVMRKVIEAGLGEGSGLSSARRSGRLRPM